jgi:hypothetical protein
VSVVTEGGVFEIDGERRPYDLSLSVEVCPGVFWRTKQITIAPRYCFVNCLDTDVCIKQAGRSHHLPC